MTHATRPFLPSAIKVGSTVPAKGVRMAAASVFAPALAFAFALGLTAPAMAQANPNLSTSVSTPVPAAKGLTLEHRMLLKCSAAFALVAHGQAQGQADMLGYKVNATQGREYFVQAMAQVMDDTGFSREEVTEQLTQEAQRLSAGDGKGIAEIMPVCEVSLASFTPPAAQGTDRASGLP